MSGIIQNSLVVVFISYGMSKLLESYFGKELSLIPVGFFCYLGILQIFNYGLVTIGLNAKIFLVLYFTLGLVPYVIGFIKKIDFKPTKMDLVSLAGGLIFVGLGIYKSMNTTLGLVHFDTSFYMSLVNEKSVATQLGGPFSIHFYSGVTQSIDPTYDYQAFYIFEAMVIKLLRTLHLVEASGSVNYIWSASISFYLMMGMTLVNFFNLLFKDKKILGSLWLTLGAYLFFFKYYDLVFAFYGNSWRIMVISYLSYYIHLYLKEEDIKYSILIGLIGSGLIAFSSSGGFMMAFVGAALMIYSMFKSDSLKHYLISMIPLIFTLPYLIIVLCGMSKLLGLVIGAAVMIYILGVLLYSKRAMGKEIFFKTHKILCILAVAILWGYSSLIQRNSKYPYLYFFANHSEYDMVHDYFGAYSRELVIVNVIFWSILIIYMVLQKDVFRKYLLILLMVFINPLITPFIIKYLTNFVFYRDFELVINLYTLGLFISALTLIKWDKVVTGTSICVILFTGYLAINEYLRYFTAELVPSENFDQLYRLDRDDMEVFERLQEECTYDRFKVISQAEGVKAYVSHIELVYSVYDTRHLAVYENELDSETIVENDRGKIVNILYHRDYTDQPVFKEAPEYDKLNDMIMEYGTQYLIIRKDQFKLKEGEYVPIYFDVRGIADIILENDTYVLMKVR